MKALKIFTLFTLFLNALSGFADPGSLFTEIIVINESNYEAFEDIFGGASGKRVPALKYLPHPRNSNYLAIYHCMVTSSEQAIGGRNCRGVNGGEFYHIQDLSKLEKVIEDHRRNMSILKEVTIFAATMPIGGGIYRGLAKGVQLVRAGALAYRSVKWGAFGISFAADILIGVQIDNLTEDVFKVGVNNGLGKNVRCETEDCQKREAVVTVDDKVKLTRTFQKLGKAIPETANRSKLVAPYSRATKKRSRACSTCFRLEVVTDYEEMWDHPVY